MNDTRRKFNGQLSGTATQSQAQLARRRGSFDGTLNAVENGQQMGHAKFSYSGTQRTLTVSNLQNQNKDAVKGVGSALFNQMENIGRKSGANKVETTLTAPEAQGFYRKMGLRPDANMAQSLRDAAQDMGQSLTQEEAEAKTPIWRKPI